MVLFIKLPIYDYIINRGFWKILWLLLAGLAITDNTLCLLILMSNKLYP